MQAIFNLIFETKCDESEIVKMKKKRAIRVDNKGNLIIIYEDWTEEVMVGAGNDLIKYLKKYKGE